MKLIERKEQVIKNVVRIIKSEGAILLKQYSSDGNDIFPDAISMYFEIGYGLAKKKFRISDHTFQHKDSPDQKLLDSITVSDKTSFNDIERFVKNRIKNIKRGSLFAAFDYISKCA